ncbi:MAG: SUMF1/EgtB/PvdO family nonheme iron enzyme, partial [Anaerolineae bacterium]|nr:SUMF1/EgtB/PvdO family nonheme iron enzyme [Anaerolineae bacterium]
MARFFITYHIHDEDTKTEFVRRLKKAFPNDHFQVDDEQTYSDEWWEDVLGEIQRCDIFIYLVSRESSKDEKAKAEFSEAQRWRRPIIAVNLSKKEKIFLTDNPDDITYIPISDFESLIGKINQQKEHLPDKNIGPIRDMPTLKPKSPKTIPIYNKTKKMKKGLLIPLTIIIVAVITVFMINSRNNIPLEQPPALGYPNGEIVKQNTDWQPVEREFNGVTMVLVPRGCFMMGSNHNEDSDEKPVHEQCFEMPFWIDKYEVSQLQFDTFGAEKAKENGFNGSSRPVENITWFEAQAYCAHVGGRL